MSALVPPGGAERTSVNLRVSSLREGRRPSGGSSELLALGWVRSVGRPSARRRDGCPSRFALGCVGIGVGAGAWGTICALGLPVGAVGPTSLTLGGAGSRENSAIRVAIRWLSRSRKRLVAAGDRPCAEPSAKSSVVERDGSPSAAPRLSISGESVRPRPQNSRFPVLNCY